MFIRVSEQFTEIPEFETITLVGDPGCDGLGAATMSIFAKSLYNSTSDLVLLLGDMVPTGAPRYYESVITFINRVSDRPVYPLCGNHDTKYYDKYCGLRNYALYSKSQLILVLDNSSREFSPETLAFAREALENYSREEIVVAFHIPPPNGFTENAISQEQWDLLSAILEPYGSAISLIATGHVHSFFRDTIDDYPLVVSGGGGARIEFVHEDIPIADRVYHSLEYSSGSREITFTPLDPLAYDLELHDEGVATRLETAYINETQAHFRYKLYAEQMDAIGEHQLAHLFRALSDSEYYHARNHFSALNSVSSKEQLLAQAIRGETYEVDELYREDLNYSIERQFGLSEYSFMDSMESEKVHRDLLIEAQEGNFADEYATCTSCGFTFAKKVGAQRCPICGAPHDKIVAVE